MSVVAYTGLPGSGKSYGVVENVILPCLKEGRPIVTNLPLKLGELQDWCRRNNSPQPRIDIVDLEVVAKSDDDGFLSMRYGAVHVFDEVWRVWPSGQKVTNAPKSHREYFAEHRHQVDASGRSTEIVLITQDLAQIASWVRQLVDETYRAQKLNHVGQDKRYRVDVYQGAVTGQKPPESRLLRQFYGSYSPKVYSLYQSATKSQKSGMHGAGKEQKADKRANILRSPKILFSLIGAPVLGVFALVSVFSMLESGFVADDKTPDAPVTDVSPVHIDDIPEPVPVASEPVAVASEPVYSDPDDSLPPVSRDWKLVGSVRIPAGMFYVVSNNVGYRYVDPSACHEYPGGFQMWCHVDGKRVDSTSGYQTATLVRTPARNAM
jgi:zona occludens toxin